MCSHACLSKHTHVNSTYTYVHDHMCGNFVGVVYSIKNNYEYVNWLDLDLYFRGKK